MPERENHKKLSRRSDEKASDPFEQVRKLREELEPEWEASEERSKRALAEMEVALKLRSR
jgi:hypothetical protein